MPPRYLEERSGDVPEKLVPFRDLTAFESQFVMLFRQLSADDQHDELVRLNQRVDRAAQGPSAQNPWRGRLDRRHTDRREDPSNSSTEGREVE